MTEPAETSEPVHSTASSRRLWLVFGVAGLLIVFMGGVVVWLPWHRQVDLLAEFNRLGAIVGTAPAAPDWLRGIIGNKVMRGFEHVDYVEFKFLHATDTGLAHVKKLTELQTLEIGCSQVTDSGLVHLKELTELRTLVLSGPQISDVGLVHLKELKELRTLVIIGTQITDAGLLHLKGLTNLEALDILETQVTDAGVKDLRDALPKCRKIRTSVVMPTPWD